MRERQSNYCKSSIKKQFEILEILEADLDLNLAHYDRGTYLNIEEREKGGRSSVSVE